MNRTEERLRSAFTDATETVQPHSLRPLAVSAPRHRTSTRWITPVVAAASVGVVAAGVVALQHEPAHHGQAPAARPSPLTAGHSTLPTNTADELALVRKCMIGDPFIPPKDMSTRSTVSASTGPGTHVGDFRVLAIQHDTMGQILLLGSKLAYRTCDIQRSGKVSRGDQDPHQTANRWFPGFTSFRGPVDIESGGGGDANGDDGGKTSKPTPDAVYENNLIGRVTPDIARLTFTASNGTTTAAGVSHGFFVWRVLWTGDTMNPNVHPRTFFKMRAYDRSGRLLVSTMTWT